jgi:hypothetical protein
MLVGKESKSVLRALGAVSPGRASKGSSFSELTKLTTKIKSAFEAAKSAITIDLPGVSKEYQVLAEYDDSQIACSALADAILMRGDINVDTCQRIIDGVAIRNCAGAEHCNFEVTARRLNAMLLQIKGEANEGLKRKKSALVMRSNLRQQSLNA